METLAGHMDPSLHFDYRHHLLVRHESLSPRVRQNVILTNAENTISYVCPIRAS